MTHARQQLRDLAVTAITGLATTGTNVHNGRVFPVEQTDLPAWFVTYGDEEEIEPLDFGGLQERAMRLAFVGVARELDGATVLDTLDTMAEELEVAVDAGLAGAYQTQLESTEHDLGEDELDQAFGMVVVVYRVHYQTEAGIPGTLA